jgi:hypothetical protein
LTFTHQTDSSTQANSSAGGRQLEVVLVDSPAELRRTLDEETGLPLIRIGPVEEWPWPPWIHMALFSV